MKRKKTWNFEKERRMLKHIKAGAMLTEYPSREFIKSYLMIDLKIITSCSA